MPKRSKGSGTALRKRRLLQAEAQNHRCAYCGADIRDDATLDHIIPISKGGSRHSRTNHVAACRSCNTHRGNMDAFKFFKMVQRELQ